MIKTIRAKGSPSVELNNERFQPKTYYVRHMHAGLAGYDSETVKVGADAIKRMIPSGLNKPVYILHQDALQRELKDPDGWITESFWADFDGYAWFKLLITTPEADSTIGKGWSVSNSYIPTHWGPAGELVNVPYDREVLDGEFTHVALVENPRYETADILTPDEFAVYKTAKKAEAEALSNSKNPTPQKGKKAMFFILKRETVTEPDDNSMIELENGKTVTLGELKKAREELVNAKAKKNSDEEAEKEKKKAADKADEKMNDQSMIDCGDGVKISLGELKKVYGESLNAKNNDDDDKKKSDGDDDDDDDDDKKKKDGEKDNSKNFAELSNAGRESGKAASQRYDTQYEQLKRGSERY